MPTYLLVDEYLKEALHALPRHLLYRYSTQNTPPNKLASAIGFHETSHNLIVAPSTSGIYFRLFTLPGRICRSKAMDSQVCHLFFSINCVYVSSMQGSFV
jgi:hypothetical protein